jgi:hypothetical protein
VTATQTVGDPAQTITFYFRNSDGSVVVKPPIPDAPPIWTNDAPLVQTITPAPDGMSAQALALTAGSDVVRASCKVGGVPYTAEEPVTVQPPAIRPASAALAFGGAVLSTG